MNPWEEIASRRMLKTTEVRHKSSFFHFAKEKIAIIIYF